MLGGVIELVYIQLHAQLRIRRRSQALVHVFFFFFFFFNNIPRGVRETPGNTG